MSQIFASCFSSSGAPITHINAPQLTLAFPRHTQFSSIPETIHEFAELNGIEFAFCRDSDVFRVIKRKIAVHCLTVEELGFQVFSRNNLDEDWVKAMFVPMKGLYSVQENDICEERNDIPERNEFLEEYVLKSKPVVLKGAASNWPALWKWTNSYLK
jgi:hypothetical protein